MSADLIPLGMPSAAASTTYQRVEVYSTRLYMLKPNLHQTTYQEIESSCGLGVRLDRR